MSFHKVEFNPESINEKFGISLNYSLAKDLTALALSEYQANGNFFVNKNQPEEPVIQKIIELEDDRDRSLNALFLITMMTFAGDTGLYFRNLEQKLEDEELYEKCQILFNPSQASQLSVEEVEEKAKNLLQPLGRQENALNGIYHNCVTLAESYDGQIRNFFAKHDFDAIRIVKALYVRPRAKQFEKEFWRYGPKLSILFLQWVDKYGLCPELKNVDSIGIPVDSQICRWALQTGIVDIKEGVNPHNLSFNILLPMFVAMFEETGWKPRFVSEALWAMASQGCSKEKVGSKKNVLCPVKDFCKGIYIKRNGGDRKYHGLSDPEYFFPWNE